jgi:hypothetical protein
MVAWVCGLFVICFWVSGGARIYREILFALGQSAGVNANANDGEAERGARVAGMMLSSRAPICPVFKHHGILSY